MDSQILQGRGAPRRNRNEWIAFGCVVMLVFLMGVCSVMTERHLIRSYEVQRLQGQAKTVEENLRRQLAGVRHALSSMRDSWAARDNGLTVESLGALRGAMPGVRALLVLDGTGKVILANDEMSSHALQDRMFLGSLAGMKDLQTLYVSQPYPDEPGILNIKVSMVVPTGVDEAPRIVTAVLNPDYFDVVMRSVLYADDMRTMLKEQDGRPILWVSSDDKSPPRGLVPGAFFQRRPAMGRPTSVQYVEATDQTRLLVQRTVDATDAELDRSLVIGVSRALPDLDRPWKHLAFIYTTVWLMISLFCGRTLQAAQRRRAAVERLGIRLVGEQAQHAQRMELALSSTNLGMWELWLPGERVCLDQRAAALLGYDAVQQLAQPGRWCDRVHGDDREGIGEALNRHLSGTTTELRSELRLAHRDGHWVWVQCRGRVVERDAAGMPVMLLGTWLDISERKLHEQEVERLAFYDGLTGLPNRRLLMDRLQRAVARTHRFGQFGAVMFIDLDNFKTLNDTLGHDAGDKLLTQVAVRLQEATRAIDTVARLGGDEFVVMLEGLGASHKEAAWLAERLGRTIVARLSSPYEIGGQTTYSSPSIGVALFGESCTGVEELLKHADLAMYDAKAAGRSTLRLFTPELQSNAAADAQLEHELRLALQRDELLLHYQPIFDTRGQVIAVEALIRWRHPERGMVSPGEFIPLAEKTGLILPLGQWVMESACRLLKAWSAHPYTSHISISVNVSARQFRSDDFVATVSDLMRDNEVNPRLFKLELTESMLLNDIDDVIAKMLTLKALGVGFSLDDFGTGYSSLGYLKRLPLDQLKIDQSFVREVMTIPSDAAIAKAIIEMAHSLGLNVVAEGVETAEQHQLLLENACDGFQGFLFSPPRPSEDIERMLLASMATHGASAVIASLFEQSYPTPEPSVAVQPRQARS